MKSKRRRYYRDYHNQHLTVDRDQGNRSGRRFPNVDRDRSTHKQPRLPINYVPELLLLGAVVLIALVFFLVDGW